MYFRIKTVLVTGSSRGIGKAIAFAFGQTGCRVVLNGSRNADQLKQTYQEMIQQGISCMAILADVSDYTACETMFAQIKETFGDVDILVNNAGISYIGLFTDMKPQDWQHLLAVNLHSVLHCTHLATPAMVRKQSGAIVNISSIRQKVPLVKQYMLASKGGINAFTKAMAKELGRNDIRVNAIACGVIDTEMNDCFSKEEKQALTEEIPLMRFGMPQEIAQITLYLASEQASFLTGQIITLDGGMT